MIHSHEKLMELKSKKKKLPYFVQRKAIYIKRMPLRWKKPRGKQNKLRRQMKNKGSMVKIGFGSTSAIKGMNSNLKKLVLVNNKIDVSKLTTNDAAIIASRLGMKKKLELMKLIEKRGISLHNFKDVSGKIKAVEGNLSERKKIRLNKKSRLKMIGFSSLKETKGQKTESTAHKKSEEKSEQKQEHKDADAADEKIKKDEDRKEVEKILIHEKM